MLTQFTFWFSEYFARCLMIAKLKCCAEMENLNENYTVRMMFHIIW